MDEPQKRHYDTALVLLEVLEKPIGGLNPTILVMHPQNALRIVANAVMEIEKQVILREKAQERGSPC